MRLIVNLLVICLIAAGVGLGLTALAVRHPLALDVIDAGPWVAIANEGSPDVDAYSLAALAHRGEPPQPVSDGLVFRARQDSDGNALTGACSYSISGVLPPVRVWSLSAFGPNGLPFANEAQRYGYSSADVMRDGEGAISIALSVEPKSGDWLPIAQNSGIILVLRLYDTTAAAIAGGRSAPELPAIRRLECRS